MNIKHCTKIGTIYLKTMVFAITKSTGLMLTISDNLNFLVALLSKNQILHQKVIIKLKEQSFPLPSYLQTKTIVFIWKEHLLETKTQF